MKLPHMLVKSDDPTFLVSLFAECVRCVRCREPQEWPRCAGPSKSMSPGDLQSVMKHCFDLRRHISSSCCWRSSYFKLVRDTESCITAVQLYDSVKSCLPGIVNRRKKPPQKTDSCNLLALVFYRYYTHVCRRYVPRASGYTTPPRLRFLQGLSLNTCYCTRFAPHERL